MTNKEIFDLVAEMGVLILSGSGEVKRAHDTLEVVANGFGIRDFKCYLLSNGLFISGVLEGDKVETRIQEVPVKGTNLYEVESLNSLSRKIVSQHLTPEEVRVELDKVKSTEPYTTWEMALASGVGCAAFTYLFKGTWPDTIYTFPVGVILWFFMVHLEKRAENPKIVINLFTSMLITFLACVGVYAGFADNVDKIVIGAVMPLVPGVPFVNAIRNFFSNDYLSGVVRMADAFLTALSVGIGVGVTIVMWNNIIGGVNLW